MGASAVEAEDAVHMAVVDVFRRWNEISSPAAYAKRAAERYFIKDRIRSRHVIRRIAGSDLPAESDVSAERALTLWEDRQWVEDILSSLTPAQRDVLALVADGWELQEAAKHLGKTPESVRQNLHHARQRLKDVSALAGSAADGVPNGRGPGRPPSCSRELALRIITLRGDGLSLAQISAVLNAEGVPTPMGRSAWSKSHVDRLLHTKFVRDLLAEEVIDGSSAEDIATCQGSTATQKLPARPQGREELQ